MLPFYSLKTSERLRHPHKIHAVDAAPPIVDEIVSDDLPPVWPDFEGDVRGETLRPLHPMVPKAARGDRELHELLALVDVRRIGRARELKLAEHHLRRRLKP